MVDAGIEENASIIELRMQHLDGSGGKYPYIRQLKPDFMITAWAFANAVMLKDDQDGYASHARYNYMKSCFSMYS